MTYKYYYIVRLWNIFKLKLQIFKQSIKFRILLIRGTIIYKNFNNLNKNNNLIDNIYKYKLYKLKVKEIEEKYKNTFNKIKNLYSELADTIIVIE
jgi:hypothetical protein